MFRKEKPICLLIPLTSEAMLSFQTPPGERTVTSAEEHKSHMPNTSHGGISVADHHADQSEQNEYSTAGEL